MVQTNDDFIKAHGGEIKVETNEGEGAEFVIQMPIVWTMIYKIYGINRKIPELNHTNHLIP